MLLDRHLEFPCWKQGIKSWKLSNTFVPHASPHPFLGLAWLCSSSVFRFSLPENLPVSRHARVSACTFAVSIILFGVVSGHSDPPPASLSVVTLASHLTSPWIVFPSLSCLSLHQLFGTAVPVCPTCQSVVYFTLVSYTHSTPQGTLTITPLENHESEVWIKRSVCAFPPPGIH